MKANKNREIYYKQRFSKSSEHVQGRVVDARSKQMEMEEKRELETMNRVIVKEHQKALFMKKRQKMENEKREYLNFKKQEKAQHFKLKLKSLVENNKESIFAARTKLKEQDEIYAKRKNDIEDAKYQIGDNNNTRADLQEKHMDKIRRNQKNYKVHLVRNIIDKGVRADDLQQ